MINVRQEADKIIEEASEEILGMIETELDEGDWRDAAFELTSRLGATPQEHAEVMGWIDILLSQAIAKAMLERVTQEVTEREPK